VKDKKAWNDMLQKTNKPREVVVEYDREREGEGEGENNSLWLYYTLYYVLNTFKYNIIQIYLYIIIYATNTG
jgi:hypothetical protein